MPTLDELIAHHAPARDVSAATVRDAASAAPVLVVLDDDPTGTQSIHDLPVLTRWDEDDLEWALSQRVPALYVLTNTRSLDPDAAEQRNREVARAAQSVAKRLGVEISFVSRSDSTLRGHFPLETDTLVEEVEAFGGPDIDGVIIAPAFPDAASTTSSIPISAVARCLPRRPNSLVTRHSDMPPRVLLHGWKRRRQDETARSMLFTSTCTRFEAKARRASPHCSEQHAPLPQ